SATWRFISSIISPRSVKWKLRSGWLEAISRRESATGSGFGSGIKSDIAAKFLTGLAWGCRSHWRCSSAAEKQTDHDLDWGMAPGEALVAELGAAGSRYILVVSGRLIHASTSLRNVAAGAFDGLIQIAVGRIAANVVRVMVVGGGAKDCFPQRGLEASGVR